MPGLTFYLNYKYNTEDEFIKYLSLLRCVYKVPTLKYSENHIIGKSFLVYSCIPEFIIESKLLTIENYVIALDGDFYNENEIMNYLKRPNLSKLEVIYYLFKKEGSNFARFINGEFNIIIFESIKKDLLVTNDRFSRRSFFYKKLADGIVFSSEKKGIIALSEENSNIDPQGLLELFIFRHNLKNRSYIEEISKIPIASSFVTSPKSFYSSQYFKWDFSKIDKNYDRETRLKEISDAIKNAIDIRIKNKKRIMLWLSGGYDSRTIACFINENHRERILCETFGENDSEDLQIARLIASKLNYKWRQRKVLKSYLQIAQMSSWRSEFSVPGLDHPFIGNHLSMKNEANYILHGLPGVNEINGGHIRLGKILASLKPNPYENFFQRYASKKDNISCLFNKKYFNEYYEIVKSDFINFFEEMDAANNLYKWDTFNLTQRQPNYSNMADLVESDLFEVIHPFTDINLILLFTQIPLKDKLLLQITKDLLHNYCPDIRDIPIDEGRGYIKNNNSLSRSIYRELKSLLRTHNSAKSIIWDKKKAIQKDYLNIRKISDDLFFIHEELKQYFDFDMVRQFIDNKELLINNQSIFDIFVTFIYSYNQLIKNSNLEPPLEISENYNKAHENLT